MSTSLSGCQSPSLYSCGIQRISLEHYVTNNNFCFVADIKLTLQSSYEWKTVPVSFL